MANMKPDPEALTEGARHVVRMTRRVAHEKTIEQAALDALALDANMLAQAKTEPDAGRAFMLASVFYRGEWPLGSTLDWAQYEPDANDDPGNPRARTAWARDLTPGDDF